MFCVLPFKFLRTNTYILIQEHYQLPVVWKYIIQLGHNFILYNIPYEVQQEAQQEAMVVC